MYAKAIVSRFGLETIDIIENDIERLLEVPRLGRKRMEKIRESWERQKDIKEVMVFLQGYGVSTAYAAKIYRQYQKDAIKTVKENPYKLADDIWGIGFKTADGIASRWDMRTMTLADAGAVSYTPLISSPKRGMFSRSRNSW